MMQCSVVQYSIIQWIMVTYNSYMFGFLLGKDDKQDKKVESDINAMLRTQLKKQFCELCQKRTATKVAFGKEFKSSFTCSSCELEAVGGVPQRLGTNLIEFENFVEVLSKEIISYQSSQKTPPLQLKKPKDSCDNIQKSIESMAAKISEQYKKLKKVTKQKEDELVNEAMKQNTVPIFEDISKVYKDNKLAQFQSGQQILKRSLVNNKGLHFSDEDGIQSANQAINERFTGVKKESKIKLRPLQDLIEEINNITLN